MPKPRGILTSRRSPKTAPAVLPSDGEEDMAASRRRQAPSSLRTYETRVSLVLLAIEGSGGCRGLGAVGRFGLELAEEAFGVVCAGAVPGLSAGPLGDRAADGELFDDGASLAWVGGQGVELEVLA